MHLVKDENGNVCSHSHDHEHPHSHSYEHIHGHSHEHGQEDSHTHTHGHEETGGCSGECSGCDHDHSSTAELDKNAALLNYMLQHNQSHAAELDQMAAKLQQDGMEQSAEQIRKAVDEFQKGNMYLGLALALVKDNH